MKGQISLVTLLTLVLSAAGAGAQHDHYDHQQRAAGQDKISSHIKDVSEAVASRRPAGPHGGSTHESGNTRVEIVVELGGLRLFAYDQHGRPLDLRAARGLATLQVTGEAKRYRYDLFPEVRADRSCESVATAIDLSRIAGRPIELTIQLIGVSGAERRPAQFAASLMVPMTGARRVAAAIAAQGVCPVSGQPLGSMGQPVAVTIGERTVYVCCAGCIDALKADPAKFLATQRRLTVVPATAADAEAIARQRLCPVMDEPLGSMGTPLKVTGLERDVFLCCKGCLKFLEKEPQKYLAKLPPLPDSRGPTVVKATAEDGRFVAAQRLCPVMDEPLGAMGGPYKTVVEGRVVFICCPGCAKKLHADPATYLAKLREQGVTPPMVQ